MPKKPNYAVMDIYCDNCGNLLVKNFRACPEDKNNHSSCWASCKYIVSSIDANYQIFKMLPYKYIGKVFSVRKIDQIIPRIFCSQECEMAMMWEAISNVKNKNSY